MAPLVLCWILHLMFGLVSQIQQSRLWMISVINLEVMMASFIVYEAKDGDVFSNKSLTLIAEITETLDNYEQISDDVWLNQYGLTPDIVESLTHIKRVQSLSNIRIQKNEDDVLSSPRLVPKNIPSETDQLSAISSEADDQPSLELFMFSKDHRYGAISIKTDFGAIPVVQES